MPQPVVSLRLRLVQLSIPVAVVFGGMWLGHYMMADRPMPTVVAAAPAVPGPTAGPLAVPVSQPSPLV